MCPWSPLLLDALGTLVRLEPPAPRLRTELAERFGDHGHRGGGGARALPAEIRFYRAHLDEGRDAASLQRLRRRCAEVLRTALPASERLAAGRDRGADRGPARRPTVHRLRRCPAGDRGGALTGAAGRRRLATGTSRCTRCSTGSSCARCSTASSPQPRSGPANRRPAVFERALALAGASAAEAVHVGDSVEEDVAGARAAGIEPILLSRDGRPAPPGVRCIASLSELTALAP